MRTCQPPANARAEGHLAFGNECKMYAADIGAPASCVMISTWFNDNQAPATLRAQPANMFISGCAATSDAPHDLASALITGIVGR